MSANFYMWDSRTILPIVYNIEYSHKLVQNDLTYISKYVNDTNVGSKHKYDNIFCNFVNVWF